MLPKPEFTWFYTGSWPFSLPGVWESQIKSQYPDLVFSGPGWYETHHLLIEDVGEREGKAIFAIHTFRSDPRPEFFKIAALPDKG